MTDRPRQGKGNGGKYLEKGKHLEQENTWDRKIFGTGKYLDGGKEEEQREYLRKILFCQHCSVRCTVVVVSLHLQMANDKIYPELRYNFIQVLPPPQKSHWPDG